jgi:hypothetical protein
MDERVCQQHVIVSTNLGLGLVLASLGMYVLSIVISVLLYVFYAQVSQAARINGVCSRLSRTLKPLHLPTPTCACFPVE